MKTFYTALSTGFILIILGSAFATRAQSNKGFIFGTIVTVDNGMYTGPIRWNDEEVFWTDHFNSIKTENEFIKYMSDQDLKKTRNQTWWEEWLNIHINEFEYNKLLHNFVCRFGDIKTLHITGRTRVELELKNDRIIELQGGSNDIGTRIKVLDQELGLIKIDWSRIQKVEFCETPSELETSFGEPLYGTVTARNNTFTGQVQWDHDERITTDFLDGDTEDGDVSIAFGKIKSIKKEGNGSRVLLLSGKELFLDGSNDVNNDNRGIIVTVEDLGRVDIPWDQFIEVHFDSSPELLSYSDFNPPEPLSGTVSYVDDEPITGRIIFDLDEHTNIEVLEGKDDDIEFLIPFEYIKRIKPKNYAYSEIELRNGKIFILGKMQDVSEKNDGILVSEVKNTYIYIPWEKIEEIVFK